MIFKHPMSKSLTYRNHVGVKGGCSIKISWVFSAMKGKFSTIDKLANE